MHTASNCHPCPSYLLWCLSSEDTCGFQGIKCRVMWLAWKHLPRMALEPVLRGPSLSKESDTSAWELCPSVPMAFSLLSLPLDAHEYLIPCVKWLLFLLLAQPAKVEMPSGCSGEVTLLYISTQKEDNLCCQCLNKLFWGNCLLYETLRQESFPVLCFPW